MGWVCVNCSNYNAAENKICTVCGFDCPSHTDGFETGRKKAGLSLLEESRRSVKQLIDPVLKLGEKVKDIKEKIPSRAELGELLEEKIGLAKKKLILKFEKPWPEQKIKFNIVVIISKGFIRSERTVNGNIKGYTFYRADGTALFMEADMLVECNMATEI